MLVHKQFYEGILNEMPSSLFERIKYLSLFNTIRPIWEEAKNIEKTTNDNLFVDFKLGKITEEEYYSERKDTPDWIIDLYKVATFMGRMGIPPHPNFAIDQVNFGEIYEDLRNKCK